MSGHCFGACVKEDLLLKKKTNTGFDLTEQYIYVSFKGEFVVEPDSKVLVARDIFNVTAIQGQNYRSTLNLRQISVKQHTLSLISI